MRDEWTKKLPDDRTVIHTSEIGGVITVWVRELFIPAQLISQ
jgi:hypothetical protein